MAGLLSGRQLKTRPSLRRGRTRARETLTLLWVFLGSEVFALKP